MRRRRPDRDLRRAVTDLSRLHPEDLEMILDALEPDERARIAALISGLGGSPVGAENARAAPEVQPVWTWQGVSPWLCARIDPEARTGRSNREFVLLTDATREALVAAAEPFRVQRGRTGPGRSLMGFFRDKLAGILS